MLFTSGSYLLRASDEVFKALYLQDTEVVDQTYRENHLKLATFLETAEDNVNSAGRKKT